MNAYDSKWTSKYDILRTQWPFVNKMGVNLKHEKLQILKIMWKKELKQRLRFVCSTQCDNSLRKQFVERHFNTEMSAIDHSQPYPLESISLYYWDTREV